MKANAVIKTNPWLYWFAVLTAFATFLLLGLGGLVTSHEAGMSVPDWPTSYGYNMFALPIKMWKGGAFFEHTHRLLATLVGLFSTVLAVWLWARETQGRSRWIGVGAITCVFVLIGVRQMPVYLALLALSPIAIGFSAYRFAQNPTSLRWLGVMAFALVVPQGVLGGLRVVWFKDQIGIVHGTIAQLFFVLTCALALFTSRFWAALAANRQMFRVPSGLRSLGLATTLLILGQLILGATMRHQHAGLAIPDFPLAYGSWWPDTRPDAVADYNAHRGEVNGENSISAFQIELQMAHRLAALAIFILVAGCAGQTWRRLGGRDALTKLAWGWLVLILTQVALGAATIWSNKAADVATAHVLVGALALMVGALWCILAFRRSEPLTETQPSGAFGTQPVLAANK